MVIALDFDGVIANSMYDAMVTAKIAYCKLFPNSPINGQDITDAFSKLRPYSLWAGDFLATLKAIETGTNIKNQEEYNQYKSKFDKNQAVDFYNEFYVGRYLMQQKDIKKWCELTPPFQVIVDKLKDIDMKDIYIVTSKDYRSVSVLLNHYGIPLPPDHILDNTIKDKLFKLRVLGKLKDIVFVEDLLASILPIKKKSHVKCYLATWGFSNEVQRKRAGKEGIKVINEDQFGELIKMEVQ